MFSGADWIVVILAVGAGVAGAIGAWAQHRKGSDDGDDEPPRPRRGLMTITLDEDDRDLIQKAARRIEDALGDHGERLHRALGDHGEKIERQTEALGRKPD